MSSRGESDNEDMREIVREALVILGPCLARSAESLLSLALMKIQYLSRELMSAGGSATLVTTKKNIEEYSTVLLEVLEYTQVEQLGVGCVGLATNDTTAKDFGRKTARALREQLTSLRSSSPY